MSVRPVADEDVVDYGLGTPEQQSAAADRLARGMGDITLIEGPGIGRRTHSILWELTDSVAAITLGALVGRRVDLEQRVRGSRPAVWLRELADVQQAEASLRAALGMPAEQWTEAENREAWGR